LGGLAARAYAIVELPASLAATSSRTEFGPVKTRAMGLQSPEQHEAGPFSSGRITIPTAAH
jgi:hypothetical protein